MAARKTNKHTAKFGGTKRERTTGTMKAAPAHPSAPVVSTSPLSLTAADDVRDDDEYTCDERIPRHRFQGRTFPGSDRRLIAFHPDDFQMMRLSVEGIEPNESKVLMAYEGYLTRMFIRQRRTEEVRRLNGQTQTPA